MQFINLRLQGYKHKDIAKVMNIKLSMTLDCARQLKELWQSFNK